MGFLKDKLGKLHIGGDHDGSKPQTDEKSGGSISRVLRNGSKFKTPGSTSGATHQAQSLLGRGGEAETWLCRDLSTGKQCAVKLFKRPVDPDVAHQLVQGINIQAELGEGCANIITLHQVCLTDQHLAVLMDVALGGNLTSYVSDQYKHAERHGLFLTEASARFFFRQFISTVAFCHRHHIAHRDLKLDNALLDTEHPPRILLTDFGFAARWGAGETPNMRGHLGTLVYSAPELLHGDTYEATAVDVWASGVLLVVSLLGAFPWDVPGQGTGDPRQESDEIWREETQIPWSESPVLKDHVHLLSPECHDLLDKIFVVDPKRRITIPQIMEHPFYKEFLTDGNKVAWEKMQAEQQELDAWRQATPIDPAKVTARTNELEALVRQATKTVGSSSKRGGPIVRPLQMLRLKGEDVHCIIMKRAAVAAQPGTMGRSSLEAPYA